MFNYYLRVSCCFNSNGANDGVYVYKFDQLPDALKAANHSIELYSGVLSASLAGAVVQVALLDVVNKKIIKSIHMKNATPCQGILNDDEVTNFIKSQPAKDVVFG